MRKPRSDLVLIAAVIVAFVVAAPFAAQAVGPPPATPGPSTPVPWLTITPAPWPTRAPWQPGNTRVPTPPQNVVIPTPDRTRLATFIAGIPTVTPSPVRGPDPCLTPVPAGASWTRHTTVDGSLTFEYPANWTIVGETGDLVPGRAVQSVSVFIVSTPESCRGSFGASSGVREGFFLLAVRVHLNGLRGYASLDARLAAFGAPDPAGNVTRTEGSIAGRRAIREKGVEPESRIPGEVVYFAEGDTYFSISGANLIGSYVATFEQVLKRITVNAGKGG